MPKAQLLEYIVVSYYDDDERTRRTKYLKKSHKNEETQVQFWPEVKSIIYAIVNITQTDSDGQ